MYLPFVKIGVMSQPTTRRLGDNMLGSVTQVSLTFFRMRPAYGTSYCLSLGLKSSHEQQQQPSLAPFRWEGSLRRSRRDQIVPYSADFAQTCKTRRCYSRLELANLRASRNSSGLLQFSNHLRCWRTSRFRWTACKIRPRRPTPKTGTQVQSRHVDRLSNETSPAVCHARLTPRRATPSAFGSSSRQPALTRMHPLVVLLDRRWSSTINLHFPQLECLLEIQPELWRVPKYLKGAARHRSAKDANLTV